MTKVNGKTYHIFVSHDRKITEGDKLKIDIKIRLTDDEKKLMDRQQLQVNESIMLETGGAKTISYTHMIEHIIQKTEFEIDDKIEINAEDESDAIVLKKWIEQLLDQTEKHILKAKQPNKG